MNLQFQKKILFCAFTVFIFSCKQQSIQYQTLTNVQLGRIALPYVYVTANVRCFNPNRFSFNISKIDGNVHIDQQSYGELSLIKPTQIPQKDTFEVPVQLKLDLAGSIKNLPNLLRSLSKDSALVKIEGTIHATKKNLSLKYPIFYEGFQSLKFN